MLNTLKESLWQQFGASIDTLGNAIRRYPEDNWNTHRKFFYIAYHCLIFLDYYLTIPNNPDFTSPLPFTIAAEGADKGEALDDIIPDRIYTKQDLLEYLDTSREKCRQVIAGLTAEKISERWIETDGDMDYAVLELLLYNMRHVQHHAAQLNMILRQVFNDAPKWVSGAKDKL
ncbi:MAG TPA: DinB family protein [Chitinophaga sp.]|uniref:DinB family protein n=1 Tax=Chitinophaga sp. TaxID=1869181 RepID=UPI002CA8C5B3|nr:DinB family protein [Chitinophaga sp.]HVI47897.1 DinB family protein [Chitinophaga sp.]